LGAVALVAAVALRWLLDPLMGDTLPLVTIFGAVTAAAWIGGSRPAIAVALLGYLACNALFIHPRGHFDVANLGNAVGLGAYLFTSGLIIVIGEAMRGAQDRARAGGELLRVTLRSIGDGVITTDVEGRVTGLNKVAETLTGWGQGDARGQPLETVFRILDEETRRPIEHPVANALRAGTVVGLADHTVLVRKDGSELPIDDSAAPIEDDVGGVSGCVLIFRDASGQRRLEQEKARQLLTTRLLASIVESSEDAVISKSLDGVIQSWNASAERLFGFTAAEAVGRHISLVIPAERIAEEDHIIASLKAGRRIEHFETERLAKDGRRIPVSLTISPIKDEAGQVVGASKIVRDITDRKRAEDELRRLAADLSEAGRRKDEFLATLAHELRKPLAPLSKAVQVLRRTDGDADRIRPVSEMLERQVRQMVRLVDDLLDMSRITQGKIELRKQRVELAAIVDQAVEAARALYEKMGHELKVAVPPSPIWVDADPTRLAQVVGNLLNNAAKFTDRGGHVRLGVERDGGEAVIRVRDTGIGIAPQQLPRLFEMFMQVDTSLERSRDGLGIGLTLVKNLVEMHGGTVEVRSEGLGRGTEFVVRLPILIETAEPREEIAVPARTPPVRRRILIVDDNVDGVESMAMMLQLGGHETHIAHDGLEAMEAVERLLPDAVLLDIGLPRLNGYEVCRRIRQEAWGKDLVLVAVTGWGQQEDRRRSTDAGFSAHVVKPVDPGVLMKLLESLYSSRSGR